MQAFLSFISGRVWLWLNRNEHWMIPLLRKAEHPIPEKSVWLVYFTLWILFVTLPFLIVGWLFTLTPIAEICRMALYTVWLILMVPVSRAVFDPFTVWRRTRIK